LKGKKPKKTLIKKISTELLDREWSKRVREDAKGRCEYCGIVSYPNAHHIFGRRNFGVRWDLDNGICLCSNHHKFDNKFSAHMTPTEFTLWLVKKRGEIWYQILKEKAMKTTKKSYMDLQEVRSKLNELP
jgi:hypothetical protein